MKNDKGQDIPIQMTDNEDATYTVDYCPPAPGNYTVIVRYGGNEIPQSPIRVPITASVDVSKIKVDGLEPSKSGRFSNLKNHIISSHYLYLLDLYTNYFYWRAMHIFVLTCEYETKNVFGGASQLRQSTVCSNSG